jgi:hypothetical protein
MSQPVEVFERDEVPGATGGIAGMGPDREAR